MLMLVLAGTTVMHGTPVLKVRHILIFEEFDNKLIGNFWACYPPSSTSWTASSNRGCEDPYLLAAFDTRPSFAFCLTMASRMTGDFSFSLVTNRRVRGSGGLGVTRCYMLIKHDQNVFLVRACKGFMVMAMHHLVECGLFGGKYFKIINTSENQLSKTPRKS